MNRSKIEQPSTSVIGSLLVDVPLAAPSARGISTSKLPLTSVSGSKFGIYMHSLKTQYSCF